MPEYEKLTAEPRSTTGKEVKRLRRVGVLPGIVYGPAIDEPQKIGIEVRDFDRVFQTTGSTSLIELSVGDATHTVFIRGVQRHPVRNSFIHAEFYAPNLNKVTEVTVPIVTVGHPAENSGGVLNHGRADVQVRGLPANIPQHLEIDLAGLKEIDDVLTVGDLTPPPGVEILTPADDMVVRLSAPQRVAQPEAAEELVAEETGDFPAEVDEGAEPEEE
ncbi:MAG: 50S ribosomal protein L25 [Nitrolancea sp.]